MSKEHPELTVILERVVDATIRRDLVLSLITQAYNVGFSKGHDEGFNDGCEEVRHELRRWAEY